MKTRKLIRSIRDQLDAHGRQRRTHRKAMRKVVRKIESREKDLEKSLEKTSGDRKRKAIKKELAVLRAQRKKGARLLREIESAGI